MSISVGSRAGVLFSNRQISIREADARTSFERIGSGRRINRGSDDAASLSIAANLNNKASLSSVAARNISDGVSLGSIAQGTLSIASDITTRLTELAAQSSNGVLNDSQRQALDAEYQALRSELDRIGATTQFNGQNVFGNSLALQVGTDGGSQSQLNLNIAELSSSALGLAQSIATQEQAQQALDQSNTAAAQILSIQSQIGSSLEALQYTFSQIGSSAVEQLAAAGRLTDADLAEESSNLSASEISLNATTALAAHSASDPQVVLQLLS